MSRPAGMSFIDWLMSDEYDDPAPEPREARVVPNLGGDFALDEFREDVHHGFVRPEVGDKMARLRGLARSPSVPDCQDPSCDALAEEEVWTGREWLPVCERHAELMTNGKREYRQPITVEDYDAAD